jgi:LPXTG-motif cell wall-anchored protein
MNRYRFSVLWVTGVVVAVFSAGPFVKEAVATHETDHRYTVFGYVRNDKGRPMADTRVTVRDTRLDEAAVAFTDRKGYYETTLHLHNDSLGDEIVVTVGTEEKKHRATFNPDDKQTERKVQVDFGAPAAPDTGSSQAAVYGVIGAAAVAAGIGWYVLRSKRKPPKKKAGK